MATTKNRAGRIMLVALLSITMAVTSFGFVGASFASSDNAKATSTAAFVFNNTGSGEDAISFTEERSFDVLVLAKGMTKAQLEKAIADGTVKWTLSRTKGMQDPEQFPHQQLGGALEDWNTVATSIQEKQPLFTGIENSAVTKDGKTYLELKFSSKTLFGYNGIDNRDRYLVRDSILDYTGSYRLA